MTPFEAVYGRPPPSLVQFLPGEVRVQAVAAELKERDFILRQLRMHLEQAQQCMVRQANKHRRDVIFGIGEKVLVKLRPYCRQSLFGGGHAKLMPRFYGPFRVEQKIGAATYRLQLPNTSRIHPVFHVSQLKRFLGDDVVIHELPQEFPVGEAFEPDYIVRTRVVSHDGNEEWQVLVRWKNRPPEDSSWLEEGDFQVQFPGVSLGNKASFDPDGVYTRRRWSVYERKKWTKQGEEAAVSARRLNNECEGNKLGNVGEEEAAAI